MRSGISVFLAFDARSLDICWPGTRRRPPERTPQPSTYLDHWLTMTWIGDTVQYFRMCPRSKVGQDHSTVGQQSNHGMPLLLSLHLLACPFFFLPCFLDYLPFHPPTLFLLCIFFIFLNISAVTVSTIKTYGGIFITPLILNLGEGITQAGIQRI